MTIRDVLIRCIVGKYASGAGRASRGEFFVFFTFYVLFFTLWNLLIFALVSFFGDLNLVDFVLLYVPFVFLPPLLAVCVRRFHDENKTGWLVLLLVVPLVNLFALGLLCMRGTPGPNRFGPEAAGVRLAWR